MNHQLICFAAGKSGGHIVPCLTLIQNQYKDHQILFFSSDSALDHHIVRQYPAIADHVPLPLTIQNNNGILAMAKKLMAVFHSFCISVVKLYQEKPAMIISTGGICAIPVCLAGWILRIPFVLYELNAVPGKAVTFLAPFAQKIIVCFPQARMRLAKPQCVVDAYPVRFSQQPVYASAVTARQHLQIDSTKKVLLVLGGSQGSSFINHILEEWLLRNTHLHQSLYIIHQTGTAHLNQVRQVYESIGVQSCVFDYQPDLTSYYTAAHLVIGRAGAGTLFETLHFKKPMIIIPLENIANDHQVQNALAMAESYPTLFRVIRQTNLQDTLEKLETTLAEY